ncbi:hypothetical protein ACFP9V_16885 [Deinococcus radiopugnans]|uniref:hypothetical protein n=1 Tax=Deinococcus radiopugnans TaxID=57497 RepID=UPI00361EA770
MTGRKKQKIRIARPPAREDSADGGNYFEVRPAKLGQRLEGLSALTKPGVRGFPGVEAAQELLAQTMRKDRVSGEVLDLTAAGGLLGSLPGVTLRAVEGSAAALTALEAAGYAPLAAVPGDALAERWPERARTVALTLAGDRGNAYISAQIAWAHAQTPPGARCTWPVTATRALTATCGRRARPSGQGRRWPATGACGWPGWCAAPAPRRRCQRPNSTGPSAFRWWVCPACSARGRQTRPRPCCSKRWMAWNSPGSGCSIWAAARG